MVLKDYDNSRTDISRSSSHGSGSSCPISRTGLHPAKVGIALYTFIYIIVFFVQKSVLDKKVAFKLFFL